MELAILAFECMYRFGGTAIRGYPSFGGESMILIALIGAGLYRLRDILK